MTAEELLKAARNGIKGTDADLARGLGLAQQRIYEYKKGIRPIPDDAIVILAEMAGRDPGQTLVDMHAQRAKGKARTYWEEITKRLCAAVIVAMVGIHKVPRVYGTEVDFGYTTCILCQLVRMWLESLTLKIWALRPSLILNSRSRCMLLGAAAPRGARCRTR